MRKPTIRVSDQVLPVHLQSKARSLKFQIYEEEGLYYLCSENKNTDQLYSYCTVDLCLCFLICRLLVFSFEGSNYIHKL